MAFRDLFSTRRATPPADVLNEAGGTAYQLTPRQALAQFAVTGCFGGTYYATATVASLIAGYLGTRMDTDRLQRWFAYLVFAVAAFVLVDTIWLQ